MISPSDVVPPPVEVFISSYSNRAKEEKPVNVSSDKLNPRSTVKKPGISTGRRSSTRKTSKIEAPVAMDDQTDSSEDEMLLDESPPILKAPIHVEVIPTSSGMGFSGFHSPNVLFSPDSVLSKSGISCSTTYCDDVLSNNDDSVDLDMENQYSSPLVSNKVSVNSERNPILNVNSVDSNQFPPLPAAYAKPVVNTPNP
ncbi:hypothetical protein L1887_25628 [Cichorium endivia]|nr:hypothetical protein L1887_25628 [Cichorium endivia]